MLDFLRTGASERKLRLFLCACCRSVWPFFTDRRSRGSVETAERHADGLAPHKHLRAARRGAYILLGEELGWREDEVESLLDTAAGELHFESGHEQNARIAAAVASARVSADKVSQRGAGQVLWMLLWPGGRAS